MRAAPEYVYGFLAHPEHLPRYAAPLWMAADPVEKRGHVHLVSLRGYFVGLPVESVQRVTVRAPASVEQTQIRGTLRGFAARCTLRATEDGTEVVYRVDVDPGISMITDEAAQQFLVQHVERTLDRIKLAAERRPAPRRPRAAPGPARPGTDEAPAEPGEEDAAESPTGPADAHEAPAPARPLEEAPAPAVPPAPRAPDQQRRRRRRRRRRSVRDGAPSPSPASAS